MIQHHLSLSDVILPEKSHVLGLRPSFPKPEVFRLLGGRGGRLGSRSTVRKVNDWTARLGSITSPRLVYTVEPVVQIGKTDVRLRNGVPFKSAKLARALRGSEAVVCFVATLGQEVEHEIGHLSDGGKLSEAYIVDAIASVGTEQTVEGFQSNMRDGLRRYGKGTTLRFSPGYCDWAIEEQTKVFRVVEAGLIGVRLMDSYLMTPRKSVSGIFGIVPGSLGASLPHNPCSLCGRSHCVARRERGTEAHSHSGGH